MFVVQKLFVCDRSHVLVFLLLMLSAFQVSLRFVIIFLFECSTFRLPVSKDISSATTLSVFSKPIYVMAEMTVVMALTKISGMLVDLHLSGNFAPNFAPKIFLGNSSSEAVADFCYG